MAMVTRSLTSSICCHLGKPLHGKGEYKFAVELYLPNDISKTLKTYNNIIKMVIHSLNGVTILQFKKYLLVSEEANFGFFYLKGSLVGHLK